MKISNKTLLQLFVSLFLFKTLLLAEVHEESIIGINTDQPVIPAFVTRNGVPWLSFGLMGGDMQPQGHVQIICNLIDFGMGLQEACDAPRFRHKGSSSPTGIPRQGSGTVELDIKRVKRKILLQLKTVYFALESISISFQKK